MITRQQSMQIGVVDVAPAQLVCRRPSKWLVCCLVRERIQKIALFFGKWHAILLRICGSLLISCFNLGFGPERRGLQWGQQARGGAAMSTFWRHFISNGSGGPLGPE